MDHLGVTHWADVHEYRQRHLVKVMQQRTALP
jgi:hypothetical protein